MKVLNCTMQQDTLSQHNIPYLEAYYTAAGYFSGAEWAVKYISIISFCHPICNEGIVKGSQLLRLMKQAERKRYFVELEKNVEFMRSSLHLNNAISPWDIGMQCLAKATVEAQAGSWDPDNKRNCCSEGDRGLGT